MFMINVTVVVGNSVSWNSVQKDGSATIAHSWRVSVATEENILRCPMDLINSYLDLPLCT